MNPTERYAMNRSAGAGNHFTAEEIGQSNETRDLYGDITPDQIFGRNASAQLAAEIRRRCPVLYASLKQLWRIECGELPRPER